MRIALLATSSLIALALATYACSSSDDTSTITSPDAGKSSTSSTGGTSSSGNSSSGSSSSSSSSGNSSSGNSSSGSTSSSTSSGSVDAGTPIDGGASGTECTTGSVLEDTSKDNGSAANAQVLPPTTGTATTTFCGRIDSTTDHDFWSLTFNVTGTGSFSSTLTSSTTPGVDVKVSIDGGPFVELNALTEFKPGKPYVFDVSRAEGPSDYRISMDIKQN